MVYVNGNRNRVEACNTSVLSTGNLPEFMYIMLKPTHTCAIYLTGNFQLQFLKCAIFTLYPRAWHSNREVWTLLDVRTTARTTLVVDYEHESTENPVKGTLGPNLQYQDYKPNSSTTRPLASVRQTSTEVAEFIGSRCAVRKRYG